RRMQLGREHFHTAVLADEAANDVAREDAACIPGAEARLHRMRDQRADFDDLVRLGGRWHVDQRAGHYIPSPSTHAASVTMTSTVCCHKLPSLMRAIAVSFCEVANLMRVATSAFPARGPSLNFTTSGKGFFSLKIAMSVTWSCSVMGL